MKFIKYSFFAIFLIGQIFFHPPQAQSESIENDRIKSPGPIADRFAYPISKKEYLTEAKDTKDEWFNARDFGVNFHLGEDWNKNSGGNTDCGEPVYAVANGRIVYAKNAGAGWGYVIIIEHTLKDGSRVQSLYGHLLKILKTSGEVRIREKIAEVGNADGKYLCHLHLEIRTPDCPMWSQAGDALLIDLHGWTDPSKFIDKHRK
jgi:murein DD-endopeptidase MepM/ murein hydrolase activator NlpD